MKTTGAEYPLTTGFHCTTPKKLDRYKATGCILPPVRFWIYEASARAWMKRTGRTVLLKLEAEDAHPLPDHKPTGHAWFTPGIVRKWEIEP